MSDPRALLEWDWLVSRGGKLLHHADLSPDAAEEMEEMAALVGDIRLTCGRRVSVAMIPGIFARMGARRCRRCCAALGYPEGVGSPKNDDACRPLVETRLDADS